MKKVVVTMAGYGRRFVQMGIQVPKYKIIADGKSLFEWSMISLTDFYKYEFIFVIREEALDLRFLEEVCCRLGILRFHIVSLDEPTDGQASSVMKAEPFMADADELIVYNIDTYINPDMLRDDAILGDYDGYIPVVHAIGDRWSFVQVDGAGQVSRIEEKVPISNLASVGFYYFRKWAVFKEIYEQSAELIKINNKETYIAPMYQYLLKRNGVVGTTLLPAENVKILGTPEEIVQFDPNYALKNM